jgi:hypothetical protein
MKIVFFYFQIVLLFLCGNLFAQKQEIYNLSSLQEKAKLQIINRTIRVVKDEHINFVQLSENKEEGLVWLPIKQFGNGIIEIEMRGKDVLQKSFIGIAFHGLNDSTYDAVYCRPFNFFAKDSVRKIHAIQYISHPQYTWKKLREEENGKFEKPIINPPNPNGWFTLKLVLDGKTVKAYINNNKEPSLIVEKLNAITKGKVGIFVGDDSGGDFKSIKIK